MKPEQQRIAIAEACGWKPCGRVDDNAAVWHIPIIPALLWDYLNDLNAMHEAEKVLNPDQEQAYVERLGAMIMSAAYDNDLRFTSSHLASSDSTYRATASQRAEAFLRTIGKWEGK